MQRSMILAGTSLLALAALAVPAFAQTSRNTVANPAPVIAKSYSWTGFYGGVNAGANLSSTTTKATGIPVEDIEELDPDVEIEGDPNGLIPLANQKLSRQSFIGGIQLGYNYQVNSFVFGAEADFMGMNASKSGSLGATYIEPPEGGDLGSNLTVSQSVAVKQNWLGTVRVRAGYAHDRALFYVTGGLAYGNAKVSSGIGLRIEDFGSDDGLNPAGVQSLTWGGSRSTTRAGYTLGAGIEYAITDNWTFRTEYLYYNLGNASVTTAPALNVVQDTIISPTTTKARIDGNIVRVGVNYKF